MDASANVAPRLDQRDLMPRIRQQPRGGKTGDARPDHSNAARRGIGPPRVHRGKACGETRQKGAARQMVGHRITLDQL
jgi:hypothetical protein